MDQTFLHIGGLVAAGFDPTGTFLLTISHNGRGVFNTRNWERIARDSALAYPKDGYGLGIGPLQGQSIPIIEMNYDTGQFE